MKNFKGVYPVIVTPMKENYEVNYEGLKENINYFIKQKSFRSNNKWKYRRICITNRRRKRRNH